MLKNKFRLWSKRAGVAYRVWKVDGARALLALIRSKLRGGGVMPEVFGKNRVLDFYDFINLRPLGQKPTSDEVSPRTMNWVIPPFGYGSGGHTTIFRAMAYLERQGYSCNVIIVGEPQPLSAETARKQINEWFFPLQAAVYLGMEAAPPAHITMATSWQTAFYVRSFQSTNHKCYFVQDFEPMFYAAGSESVWAEQTYRFGFIGITAGDWLKHKLAADYGMRTESFGFSYEREYYKPQPRPEAAARKVFFYARPPTQRRAFELGMLVLNEVVRRMPDVHVVFAGWDISYYEIPFAHYNAGIVSREELPGLFCQCDVALVLSLTNLSLLPLELMACGIPVISNRSACTEWQLNDENALLAEPTVEALADAVCHLLESPDLQHRLRMAGLERAARSDWDHEFAKVAKLLATLE